MPTLTAPRLVSSRDQARDLAAELPADLSGSVVHVDCSQLEISTSSFVDELVEVCVMERHASRLIFENAPDRTAELAIRSAGVRDVASRVEVHLAGQDA